ncbi:amidohydrolase family protein [Cupriavidus pinatubonensis]|uniref:amidohydrolase family protein n=1 Tax=Cupriavidus pinatubonensis TaxID=248026 RepID=UPI0011290161|nr:amidohydrolase family protein [Cupriavidus pinatubonensis]QYY28343.1 amidohydrolase family protein [Cupriavidus pinatubonensis]TPQ43873.1 2-pyrone-4,6-dicarboxylate hydrolase [Cupriavidus pinatubonensis]
MTSASGSVIEFVGACDCHMHVYGSRYPITPGATLRPADASVADYRRVQQDLGTQRVIVVTPSTYGVDNASTVDAIAEFGENARGVAVVDGTVTDAGLESLHQAGIRGIRLNLTLPAPVTLDELPQLAERIAPMGWHAQLNVPPAWLPEIAGMLERLPVPIVFDHYGHLPPGTPETEAAIRVIASLLDSGKAWVKLSGPYIESLEGAPHYADMRPLAQRYLALAPERTLWGSDWPHPTQRAKGNAVDDAGLLDTFLGWCQSGSLAEQVLVRNPQNLYGFQALK